MYIYFVHFIQTFAKLGPNPLWVKKLAFYPEQTECHQNVHP